MWKIFFSRPRNRSSLFKSQLINFEFYNHLLDERMDADAMLAKGKNVDLKFLFASEGPRTQIFFTFQCGNMNSSESKLN
jgi:hypothetical protein